MTLRILKNNFKVSHLKWKICWVLLLDIELISLCHTCPTQSWADTHTVRKQLNVAAILMQITTELRMQRISWNCSMLTQFEQKHLSKIYVVLHLENDAFKHSIKCLLKYFSAPFTICLWPILSMCDSNVNHTWPPLYETWHFSLQETRLVTDVNATPWLLLLHSADLFVNK